MSYGVGALNNTRCARCAAGQRRTPSASPTSTVSAKVVANLGWEKVRATHPVFAGDTLYATSTVLSKRESKSRPTQGIVTVRTTGTNQHGDVVMSFERTMLIYKREGSPAEGANY